MADKTANMDSDAEMDTVEANLLNKFRSMGTTDKDVLISQFQDLLGFQLNPSGCAFFLDMTDWNLQSAIGAYYDFEGGQECNLPAMSFVSHVTTKEGDVLFPNTPFVKTWRIQNTGKEQWPGGCCLRFINGDKMCSEDNFHLPRLSAGDTTDISINLTSPNAPGVYQGQWRTYTNTDTPFGDAIWVIIKVQCSELHTHAQEMAQIGSDVGADTSNFVTDAQSNHMMVTTADEEMGFDESVTGNGAFSNATQLHFNSDFNF